MSTQLPVERVTSTLVSAGYRQLAGPVVVSSVPFSFSAVLVAGERALDLVVVVDTLEESDKRLRQKLEGLARGLDLTQSRRPITVVLVGPEPPPSTIDAISRVARVLVVGTLVGSHAEERLRDILAVLLPLEVPVLVGTAARPLAMIDAWVSGHPQGDLLLSVTDAAELGVEAVRVELQRVLANCFPPDTLEP